MNEHEGPWGKSEEPRDEARKKNEAIDQACKYIVKKMLVRAEELHLGPTFHSSGNPTGNVAQLSISLQQGDIASLVPELALAVS